MFRRNAKPEPAPSQSLVPTYKAEVARLEAKLADLLTETEALTKLRYTEWKVRKVERRQTWLLHGVTIPETTHDIEMGRMFEEMERRMRDEGEASLQRIEEQREDERNHELEQQRIESQRSIGMMIAQALQVDLAD